MMYIMCFFQEETNLPQFGAPTPSVTIDMLETRPNTQILLDSVTPAAGEGNHRGTSRLDPGGGVMSRALSVASGSNAQESQVSEMMQGIQGDPFDEDEVSESWMYSANFVYFVIVLRVPTCILVIKVYLYLKNIFWYVKGT